MRRLPALALCVLLCCCFNNAVQPWAASGVINEGKRAAAIPDDLAPPLLRKRGVGWGLNATLIKTLEGLDWWYNWGPSIGDEKAVEAAHAAGMRFVPMQWGRWGMDELQAQIQPGSCVLLGFNEPNHQLQAALTPQEAAELWPQLEEVADRLGLRLGAPAAAPCGAQCIEPDPFKWWDEFFASCKGCRIDFLATHYYSCNIDWLVAYLRQCRKYQRPIWLTEFACPNPNGTDVISWQFMARALELLDRDSWVEWYAWYSLSTYGWLGTSNSLMDMESGKLTELGQLYLGYAPAHVTMSVPAASATTLRTADTARSAITGGGWEESNEVEMPVISLQWSEHCRPCIQHLASGGALSELAAAPLRRCSLDCGFWEQGAVGTEPRLVT